MRKISLYLILLALAIGVFQLQIQVAKLPQRPIQLFNLADKVEQVIPSVVYIKHSSNWQGSGVIISPDGIILTARHIINKGGEYTITLNDGRVFKSEEVFVSDEYDIGIIKINAKDLPISCLGNSESLRVGERLFAIGSSFGGRNFNSVTSGILSAKNRTVNEIPGWAMLFQTDAEGAKGNSGCPIYSVNGKVVGIWVGSLLPAAHYFIPIECAKNLLESVRLIFALEQVEYVENQGG